MSSEQITEQSSSSNPDSAVELPSDFPKELHACFKNGLIYLNTPYPEKDAAKHLGAKYDGYVKKWYITPDQDWQKFRRWLPIPDLPRHDPPNTFHGKIARYYMSLLEQANIDEMGRNKNRLDHVTFDELEAGRLLQDAKRIEPFWNEVKVIQDASSFPLEMPTERYDGELPPIVAVFVCCGLKATRNQKLRGVMLVLPALLTQNGEFIPAPYVTPVVNGAYFEPQDLPRLPVLGKLEHLHDTMSKLDWPESEEWADVWQKANELFASLNESGQTLTEFKTEQGKRLLSWIVPYEQDLAKVIHIKALYNQISATAPADVPLYASIIDFEKPSSALDEQRQIELGTAHTGHMSLSFGLDPTQREALRHLLDTHDGRLLAVSGPPGTGKTACLQGVIATTLVNATMTTDGDEPVPPIIIASSATNQAVTNIIKAFGDIADSPETGSIASRWIAPVRSYGWYYPAKSKRNEDKVQAFQILGRDESNLWQYFGAAEELDRVVKHKKELLLLTKEYLKLFRKNFPKYKKVTDVQAACTVLLSELRTVAQGRINPGTALSLPAALETAMCIRELLTEAGLARRRLAKEKLERKSKRDIRVPLRLQQLKSRIDTLDQKIRHLSRLALRVRGSGRFRKASGPISAFFAWMRRLLTWRKRKALTALLEPSVGISRMPTEEEELLVAADKLLSTLRAEHKYAVGLLQRIETWVKKIRRQEAQWYDSAKIYVVKLDELEALLNAIQDIARLTLPKINAEAWLHGVQGAIDGETVEGGFDLQQGARLGAAIAAGGEEAAKTAYELMDQLIDRTLRRRCFDLAARYWEGRWLIETQRVLGTTEEWEPGLRRQCMLAPVVVGTVYTLPSLFRDYTFQFVLSKADLLIIDEAGQADPSVSAGLFALARRAIVVGDIEQIKPIWPVGVAQDRGFLKRCDLHEQTEDLEERGLLASSGSVMAFAQKVTAFSDEDQRGITLLRHYRCRPTIIEYCNRLVYDSIRPLIPVTREDPQRMFHPMSYVECNGRASRENGSVVNRIEANELIGWLLDNRQRIEDFYNTKVSCILQPTDDGYRDIGDLVCIVAPFTAQCRYVEQELRKAFPQADEEDSTSIMARLTLGTIHKLQGAERPIVLFSSTNTPDDGGSPFMNADTDMLNVAVSRAQDTFVLFGHPDLFFSPKALRPGNYSPSGILGRYMKNHGRRLYPRYLVIVESPGKVDAIQKALGRDCIVIATEGHFREIESLDLTTGAVRWQVVQNKLPIIATIAKWLIDIDELVIATDDDREGEAIGWHLVQELRHHCPMDGLVISRMMFHEITEDAICQGFDGRSPWLYTGRAQAAITRAIIDKAIGQVMTAEVNDRTKRKGSNHHFGVGRVRTALFKLIAQHEERDKQTENKAWCVRALVRCGNDMVNLWLTESESFHAPAKRFDRKQDADFVVAGIHAMSSPKYAIAKGSFTLGPATPAGTAEILSAAWEKLDLRPGETSQILQDLYEGNRRSVLSADAERGD